MLSGKQKRFLRALGAKEKVLVQIGKDGLSYNLFNFVDDALRAHELVKVALLKSCELEVREAALETAAQSGAEIVQMIGRTFLLYKPNKELGEKRIILP
ncbi:MAG: YhbY family RNA-binding protein [Erysipelotrichaceae bacterium]|nr:YhbY family RNA-binding protein [Erysipelotrichaceae bacterium]